MSYRLPYEPDDDLTAQEVITEELHAPNPTRWRAMTTDTHILQTYRVLNQLDRNLDTAITLRKAHLTAIRAAYNTHTITDTEQRNHIADYLQWKAETQQLRNHIHIRRDQITPRVRELRGDTSYQHVCATLLTLALAVNHHRTTLDRAPTTADQLLWIRLHTLTYPTRRHAPNETIHTTTLADAIQATHDNDQHHATPADNDDPGTAT